jgi:hypothetical protein
MATRERCRVQDMMWAFFQNCCGLKDWVKNELGRRVAADEQVVRASGMSLHCELLASQGR